MKILEDRQPDVRRLYELKDVLFDKEWSEKTPDFNAYYMYRGVKERENLRYDITLIPFQMFGKEFPKTKGHYHPQGYGELYTVLQGKAIYLMQSNSDAYAVYAEKGDVVIVPSGYGHITINPGKEDLYMANWVSPDFSSEYDPILEKGGGCYFLTEEGWIKNDNYKEIKELRFEDPQKEIPQDLSFLSV